MASLPETGMEIDAGIIPMVEVLFANGIETFESCEGGNGHAFPEPTVRFHGNAWAGLKAFGVAMEHGLPVLAVKRSYAVVDGQLVGPEWEMTFRTGAFVSARQGGLPATGEYPARGRESR